MRNKELTLEEDHSNQELIQIGSEFVDNLQDMLVTIHAVTETDPDATTSTYRELFFEMEDCVRILNLVFVGLFLNDIHIDKKNF